MENRMEQYDPNQPVCNNQSDFNHAFRKAIRYTNKEDMKKARPWMFVYLVLWLIFIVWGLMIAMQVPVGPNRVLHLALALLFAPVYVLAHYLGALSQNGKSNMGFGTCGGGRDM